jgi:hypothetical protein
MVFLYLIYGQNNAGTFANRMARIVPHWVDVYRSLGTERYFAKHKGSCEEINTFTIRHIADAQVSDDELLTRT